MCACLPEIKNKKKNFQKTHLVFFLKGIITKILPAWPNNEQATV